MFPAKDSAPGSTGTGGFPRPRPRLDAPCTPARPDASRREPPRSSTSSTIMLYTHVQNRGGRGVRSLVDLLGGPSAPGVLDGNRIRPQ
jgi:hypothetical protein